MKFTSSLRLVLIVMAITLVACGGGGGSKSGNTAQGGFSKLLGILKNVFVSSDLYPLDGVETESEVSATAVQADGKAIVAAQKKIYVASSAETFLWRVNKNGALDSSFGTNGKLVLPCTELYESHSITPTRCPVTNILIQETGKFLLFQDLYFLENNPSEMPRIGIVRLNTDGTLDSTFADDGAFYFDAPMHNAFIVREAMNFEKEEAVVFMFSYYNGGDPNNGGLGVLGIDIDGQEPPLAFPLFHENNKRVLHATIDFVNEKYYFIVEDWLNSTSTLMSFSGNDGNVELEPIDVGARDLLVDQQGNLLVVHEQFPHGIAIRRYSPEGVLDDTFGNNGLSEVSITASESHTVEFEQALIDKNGHIIVLSTERQWNPGQIVDAIRPYERSVVFQLDSDGNLDTEFGTADGLFKISERHGLLSRVMARADDDLVVPGLSYDFDWFGIAPPTYAALYYAYRLHVYRLK